MGRLLSVRVFIRSLDPEERLKVDHVPRAQVAKIGANRGGKPKEVRVGFPRWARAVVKGVAVFLGRKACDIRLEKDVPIGLRYEAEHGDNRPCRNPRLFAGQVRNDRAPLLEFPFHRPRPMQKIEKATGNASAPDLPSFLDHA